MPLSSKLLAKIINGSAIPLFVINTEHKVTHWNTAIAALTGRGSAEVIGKDDHWKRFYPERRPLLADLIIEGASSEEISVYYSDKFIKSPLIPDAYEAEDFFPNLGAHGLWIHFTASPIKDDNSKIIGAIETLEDITERKNLEDNLRYYSQQITRAQEDERKYLARELHDDLAQILGSLARQIDNMLRKSTGIAANEVAMLQDIQAQVKRGQQSMNNLIQNLRPSLLDDLGLIPALRSLAHSLEDSEGVLTNFEVIGNEYRLDGETELSLFRVIQEALNNVRKHAQAMTVDVKVEFHDSRVRVTVRDDGRGFEAPGSMDVLPRSGKLGLMGMQERIRLLGGVLRIDSVPGKGTTLILEIPVKNHLKSPG